jgi:hypothetical protein
MRRRCGTDSDCREGEYCHPVEYRCSDCSRLSAIFDAGPPLPLFTRYDANHLCRAFPWYVDKFLKEETPEIPIKSDNTPPPDPPSFPPPPWSPPSIPPAPPSSPPASPAPPWPPAPPASPPSSPAPPFPPEPPALPPDRPPPPQSSPPPPDPPFNPPWPPSRPPPPLTPFLGAVAESANAARAVYAFIGSAALAEAQRALDWNAAARDAGASSREFGANPHTRASDDSKRDSMPSTVQAEATATAAQAPPRNETRQSAKGVHHRWWRRHARAKRRGHNATAETGAGKRVLPQGMGNDAPARVNNNTSGGGDHTATTGALPTVESLKSPRRGRSLLLGSTSFGAPLAAHSGNALNDMIKPATDQLPPELGSVKTNPGQVSARPCISATLCEQSLYGSPCPGALHCLAKTCAANRQRSPELSARVLLSCFAPRSRASLCILAD